MMQIYLRLSYTKKKPTETLFLNGNIYGRQ